jgi:hypothetical protein
MNKAMRVLLQLLLWNVGFVTGVLVVWWFTNRGAYEDVFIEFFDAALSR